jgi:hypothetical protein
VSRYYHRTPAAPAILSGGFRDAEGTYMLGITLRGVWLSDVPLDGNEGAKGGELLEVILPDDLDLSDYEVIEDGKPYRKWCAPAAMLNGSALVRLLADDPG